MQSENAEALFEQTTLHRRTKIRSIRCWTTTAMFALELRAAFRACYAARMLVPSNTNRRNIVFDIGILIKP
jgi:hypothetical protein